MNSRIPASREEWDSVTAHLPGAHILQGWEWGEFKNRFGWTVERRIWQDDSSTPLAAAQILRRNLRLGPFSATVIYLPKGPLLNWNNPFARETVLSDLESIARQDRAIELKIDPDMILGTGIPGSPEERENPDGIEVTTLLRRRGWRFSPEQIQFRNTVLLDIRPDEPVLLSRMKQKTRYNIRLAERHGVHIRAGAEKDLPLLYRMYAETADRDGFVIRPEAYYTDIWGTLIRSGLAQPLIAEVEELPVAALILFLFAGRGWYMYGMSRNLHREKMPNHLLQWESIRWLRSRAYAYYDLWGAPDRFTEPDTLRGVFSFKQGFGGDLVRHIGAWDYTPSPLRYLAYHMILPRFLDLTRTLARRRTHAVAENL